MDCIGQIDRAIMARSVIGYGSVRYRYGTLGDFFAGGIFFETVVFARLVLDALRSDLLDKQLRAGRGMFCSSGRRFNNNMITFLDDELGVVLADQVVVDDIDQSFLLNNSFAGAVSRKSAASLHEWSLQTGAGEGCSYAVTLKYPSLQEREDQIYRRHYQTLFDCPDDPRALFEGQTSTIFTT